MKALIQRIRGERKPALVREDRTPIKQKITYGVGHVFNDLCIQAWFSYVLIYYTKVIKLSPVNAGYLLVVSQIADAVSTPLIGYACDKRLSKRIEEKYGNKKIWHLIGSAGIALIWPFLYSPCPFCGEDPEEWVLLVYYGILSALFSFFWPMVEISHLSLMPIVGRRAKDALELGAIRSALKLGSGVYVYIVMWILLGQDSDSTINKKAQKPFTYQTIIVIITGGFFAILFHWGVDETRRFKKIKEEKKALQEKQATVAADLEKQALSTGGDLEKQALEQEFNSLVIHDHTKKQKPKTIKEWFKCPDFYVMMIIYFTTQNVANMVQSYFSMYLTDTMQFPKEAIAYFPLIILISGIIASMLVKRINKKFSNRVIFCFGSVLAIISAAWFYFNPAETKNAIYAPTVIMGCGYSFMIVTSLGMVADLIGDDKQSSGFVYAFMAFVDKASLGIIILIFSEYFPSAHGGGGGPSGECLECREYLRLGFAAIPGVEALIAFVAVAFFFQRRPFRSVCSSADKEDSQNEVICESHYDKEMLYDQLPTLRETVL